MLGAGKSNVFSFIYSNIELDVSLLHLQGFWPKKLLEAGLEIAPYIKTSLSPGSGVVTYYLKESGVIPALEKLGFNIVGVRYLIGFL
jgi:hypothetical protein